MKLTELTVRRPLSTFAIVLTVLVLGIYGLGQLPVDFLPNITYPLIKVHIWQRGATPEEIDRVIADPVERAMSTVDGLDYLESSSIEGMYTLQVNFRYGTDLDVAYQDALAAMARVARELPKDMDPPIVIKADPSALPILQLTVSSDSWDLVKLRDWTDIWLQERLVSVSGVAGTEIVGGLKREIRVNLDPLSLERYHLGVAEISRRLAQENLELSAGRLTAGKKEFIVRTPAEFQSLDQIREVVVAQQDGARVRLRDVATVEDSHEQADANTVTVAEGVKQRLRELKPSLPASVKLGVVEDQAQYVQAALNGVRNSALEAAALVVVLMALFLGNWRQVVAMTWALPFTVIANFAVMKLAGFSLNIFSLGGIVVAIAVDLDNSIIVIENITRLRHERPGIEFRELVVTATQQVGPAVLASTLSFLALFLPFLLVPGMASLLFHELILVITGVMCVSLVNALAVTPVMMALLLRVGSVSLRETWFERAVHRVTAAYGSTLRATLRWRVATLVAFLSLLGAGLAVAPKLGSEFLPRMDDGRIMVKVRLPTGSAVGQTDVALRAVEQTVRGDPTVESAFALVGGKVWGQYTYEIANEGEVDIQLVPRSHRKESTVAYMGRLQRALAGGLPVGKAMVMQAPVKGIRRVGASDLEVQLRGPDIERLFALAEASRTAMSKAKHLRNVYMSLDMTKPEVHIDVDRFRAAELGLSAADIATTVQSLVRGQVATAYREGDETYDLRVLVPEQRLTSRDSLDNLPLVCRGDACTRVRDVASVRTSVGPVEIIRMNQAKQVVIQADATGVSVGDALEELKSVMRTIDVPPGYEVGYGGQAQMMAEARRSLMLVIAFATFFAFVILVVQFNRLRVPAIILATVPFSLAGLILSLALTGTPVGTTVAIGLLVVVAASVTEGVLLLNYAEELRGGQSLSAEAAVVQAAQIRFRPRLMTALGVLVGFAPIALNLEEGGDMLQPMAVAAMGGLAAGVFVALYLMPLLYVMFARSKQANETAAS
jgi:CzcA family heavy metal efflux pump